MKTSCILAHPTMQFYFEIDRWELKKTPETMMMIPIVNLKKTGRQKEDEKSSEEKMSSKLPCSLSKIVCLYKKKTEIVMFYLF